MSSPTLLPANATATPVLAGGAVLVRGIGRNRRVALIERAGAWGLPRAVAADGQSLLHAAREAVRDQLGAELLPDDFAGSRRAIMKGQDLLSFYWHGRVGRTLPGFAGLSRIRWVLLEEALKRVDYPEEAELIEETLGDPSSLLTQGPKAQLRREAYQRARVLAASQAARRMELEPEEQSADPEALQTRLATCLATARSAANLRGAGATELAHALFTAAELHDCACMDPDEKALQASIVAQELHADPDPAQAHLAHELERSAGDRLKEVLSARATARAHARLEDSVAPPVWLRYLWPFAVLVAAPFVLKGTTLDSEVPPNLLPWFGAVWAGIAGGCLLPVKHQRRGKLILDTSHAWIGGAGGLLVWLAVIAGLLSGISGPPAALFGAALAGALTLRR